MALKKLVVSAVAQDPERYEAEWLPYIQEHAWCHPVERSIRLELDIPSLRGGLALVYLRPTDMPEWMTPETYPWQLYTEYGLSVPGGSFNKQYEIETLTFEKATKKLMNRLRVNMAYPEPSDEEKTRRARKFLSNFLETFEEGDTVCMNSGHGVVLPRATFCEGITLVGETLSGFMIMWDED